MLNDLQRTKLDRRFTLLDVNGDGTIQQDDYEELAQRLISGANLRPADPTAAAVASSLLDIWRALGVKVDTDRDARSRWTSGAAPSRVRSSNATASTG